MVLTGLVWLTAASTLFASMPHIECRCPDGRLKLICLTSLIAPSACCCNTTCCDETKPVPEAPSQGCCCKRRAAKPAVAPAPHAGDPESEAPAGTPQAKRDGCTKRLVQPGLAVITYTEIISTTPLDSALLDLHAPPAPGTTVPAGTVQATSFDSLFHHAPAPPDLVIVLQHFLI